MPTRRTVVLERARRRRARSSSAMRVWPSDASGAPMRSTPVPGERFVTNWIKIANDDTVTVVVPHCDMGTGIFTSLPQMAADELDADWSKVRSEAAPSDPLFANGSLAEGFILGEQNVSRRQHPGIPARHGREHASAPWPSIMDLQVTGGSSAVRATGMLRHARRRRERARDAGEGRRRALERRGERLRRPRRTASSTRRAAAASAMASSRPRRRPYDPSSHPPLKDKSQYTIVGKPVQRFDIPRKVNGTTNYGIDVKQPGMLYAAIRISPVFGAKLKSVDTGIIHGRRGIKQVVKLDDAVVVVADRFWRAKEAVADLDPVFDDAANGQVTSASIARGAHGRSRATTSRTISRKARASTRSPPADRIERPSTTFPISRIRRWSR